MKIIENILTTSPCYQTGRKITPQGLMMHSVGCPQPDAKVFVNTWKTSEAACAHAVMGPDGNVYQVLPWNHRGWHAGSPANDMFISIELTEPSSISYTGGSNFTDNNPTNTKAHIASVYREAVQFAAYICKTYNFNALDSNQLLSHSEGHAKGWATNHGDVEHLWGKYGYSMNQFRKDVNAAMSGVITDPGANKTKITASAEATSAQMISYIKSVYAGVPQSVIDMIPYYISEGKAEGIRGDVAFAQSCLETGNFKFEGSAVTLDQNNFCGMGVTSNGMKGNSFDTPQLGIRAQIQHLKAYANSDALVNACIDPRFQYVTRGCAPYVEWLGIQENPNHVGWASGAGYGSKILNILSNILGSNPGSGDPGDGGTSVNVTVKVTTDVLNIRSGPGTNYGIVGTITDQGTYTIVAISGNWGKLKSGAGWICLDYTNYSNGGSGNGGGSANPSLPCVVKVTADALNIRSGPGTNYGVVGSITDQGSYTITEVSGNWGKLKSGAGWICLDYTNYQEIGGGSGADNSGVPFKVKVTADSLRIRTGPGTSYATNGSITDQGVYTIVEVSGNWGKLKSGAGWICLDYTTRV